MTKKVVKYVWEAQYGFTFLAFPLSTEPCKVAIEKHEWYMHIYMYKHTLNMHILYTYTHGDNLACLPTGQI